MNSTKIFLKAFLVIALLVNLADFKKSRHRYAGYTVREFSKDEWQDYDMYVLTIQWGSKLTT